MARSEWISTWDNHGKKYVLWADGGEGGYSYKLTVAKQDPAGKFNEVKTWKASLDDVKADLESKGYKEVKGEHPMKESMSTLRELLQLVK